jgi:hypothetical protein
MPDDHRQATTQVTTVDDRFGTHNIRTGKVITSLSQAHATPDFLRLMKKVVAAYPGSEGLCGS